MKTKILFLISFLMIFTSACSHVGENDSSDDITLRNRTKEKAALRDTGRPWLGKNSNYR